MTRADEFHRKAEVSAYVQYCTDGGSPRAQNHSMLADWYYFKAEQCGALAKASADQHKKAEYKETQELWLELAIQAEQDDLNRIEIALKKRTRVA